MNPSDDPFQNIKGEKLFNQPGFSPNVNIFTPPTSEDSVNTIPIKGNVFGESSSGTSQSALMFEPISDSKLNSKNIFGTTETHKTTDNPFLQRKETNLNKNVFGDHKSVNDDLSSSYVHSSAKQSQPRLTVMSCSAFKETEPFEKTVFGGQLPLNTFKEPDSKFQSAFGGPLPFKEKSPEISSVFGGQLSSNIVKAQDTKAQTLFGGHLSSNPLTENYSTLQRSFGEDFSDNIKEANSKSKTVFGGQVSSDTLQATATNSNSVYESSQSLNSLQNKPTTVQTVFGGQLSSNIVEDQTSKLPIVFGGQLSSNDVKGSEPISTQNVLFGEQLSLNLIPDPRKDITVFGGKVVLNSSKSDSVQHTSAENISVTNKEEQYKCPLIENKYSNKALLSGTGIVQSSNLNFVNEKVSDQRKCDAYSLTKSILDNKIDEKMQMTFNDELNISIQDNLSGQIKMDEPLLSKSAFKESLEKNVFGNVVSSSPNSGQIKMDEALLSKSAFKESVDKNVSSSPNPDININPFTINTAVTSIVTSMKEPDKFSNEIGEKGTETRRDPLDEILAVQNQSVSPIKKDPTTLIAIDVPAKCLDKEILLNHFKKLGKVNKLLINFKSNQALIYFSDHASALNAKNKGKTIHPNLPQMKLLFKAPTVTGNKDLAPNALQPLKIKDTASLSKTRKMNFKGQKKTIKRGNSPSPSLRASNKVVSATDNKSPLSFLISNDPKPDTSTSMERYMLLDARDKVIRNKQNKILDVGRAEYLAACCPDMCPEKERYIRHVQNDLSCFELIDGILDHKLVVKQFSRSSADKEEPLPYELRSGRVLKKTMNFLLCNIVDKIHKEVVAEVWYNYMWNRTRALRNDLMQQHLVDHNAIYVLERCIRFHIHCSHEFCENSMDMNSKMNDEHLSKSLQSLRELYHDMRELNEYSVAEPEFRGYEILLNLSQGDIFFRYQKFRDSVRNSQSVQFAVKILYAFHSNNYVKFFKLVKSATYLQGCILHKYYKSMRTKTLQIIVKGYTLPNKTQLLSRTNLKMMFGMSEDSELKEFIESYGLALCAEGNTVKISRAHLISPELYNIRKDLFILAKRKALISEVINGGFLPQNPLNSYQPHNSFNELGLLTEKARNASDQTIEENPTLIKSPLIKPDEDIEKRLLIRIKIIYEMNLMRKTFHTWLQYVHNEKVINRFRKTRSLKLQRKFFNKWRSVVRKLSQLKKQADICYLKHIFKCWKASVETSKKLRKFRLEAVNQLKRRTALKYLRFWKMAVFRLKQKRMMAVKREQFLSRKYVMIWHSNVKTSGVMKGATKFYENNLLANFFSNWRDWTVLIKLQREQMNRDYPAIAGSMPIQQQNETWNWGYKRLKSENLSALAVSNLCSSINRSLNMSVTTEQDTFFASLPFPQKFQEHINNPMFTPKLFNQFFKLNVYISPDLNKTFAKWIRAKFCISGKREISRINENITIHSQSSKSQFSIVIVETDSIFGGQDSFSQVVAFCSWRDIISVKDLIIPNQLTNKLLICESSRVDMDSTVWQLSHQTLSSPEISNGLLEQIFNLWKNTCYNSNITMAKCNNVFNESFSKTILIPVQKIIDQRFSFGRFRMSPSIVLSMYNEFVDHFISCVKDRVERVIPPEVLNCCYFSTIRNEDSMLVINLLKTIRLPSLCIKEDISWTKLLCELSEYCSLLGKEWNDDIKSEIFYILQSVKQDIVHENDKVDIYAIPWTNIIFRLISYKMATLDNSIIIYDVEKLANFRPTEDYLTYLKIYTAPMNKKAQIQYEPIPECRTMKRKSESDAEMKIVRKKPKSNLLQDLAEETTKLKELEWKLQSEIDLVNIDIQNINNM